MRRRTRTAIAPQSPTLCPLPLMFPSEAAYLYCSVMVPQLDDIDAMYHLYARA